MRENEYRVKVANKLFIIPYHRKLEIVTKTLQCIEMEIFFFNN